MNKLTNISEENADVFGQQIVPFNHGLQDTGLFSRKSLAKLIDNMRDLEERHYILGAPDDSGGAGLWRNGSYENISGADLLKAVEKGRMWFQIQDLDIVAPEQWAATEQVFAELKETVPGFSFSNLRSSILISSPTARVLCHSDCAEVILLHIEGGKRLSLYDGDNEEYLPRSVLEGIVLRETEEDIPYKPEWDKKGFIFDLEPGQAMSWPHFWPHKVDNLAGLNISLQCEYFSDEGKRRYGVQYANGIMRRKAGIEPQSINHEGPGALLKCGVALMAKKLKVNTSAERKLIEEFVVDLDAPGCMRDTAEEERKIIGL